MFEKADGAPENGTDTERPSGQDQSKKADPPGDGTTQGSGTSWFRRREKSGAAWGTAPKIRLAQLAAQVLSEEKESPEEKHLGGQNDNRLAEPVPDPPDSTASEVGRAKQRWISRLGTVVSPRRCVVVIAVLLGIGTVTVVTALIVLRRPNPEPVPALPEASDRSVTATTTETTTTGSDDDASLVVSVVGKVASPGLITVSSGARAAEAIAEAGGTDQDADLFNVNLARRLTDGEQLYVGVPKPAEMESAGAGSGAGTQEVRVNLNQADQESLETLPGVGEVTARDIMDWRESNDGFTAVEQLREVDGIGEKRLERLRDKVTLE